MLTIIKWLSKKKHTPSIPSSLELELEPAQSHMAQKPVPRGEVDARALRVRCACKSDRGWVVQASAVSAIRMGIGVVISVSSFQSRDLGPLGDA